MTINKYGKKYLIVSFIFLILQAVILFVAAGKIYILRYWIFVSVNILYSSFAFWLLYKNDPELFNQRGNIESDTKKWDQYILRAHNLTYLLIQPIIIGLDYRYNWSFLNYYFMIPGFVLYLASAILVNWSMKVNRHFEATVRIQKDRDHKVISSGPYKYVRHPGYLGAILWAVGIPMILGSIYGFIASAIGITLITIRTYLEDRTLKNELDGYIDYSKRTKYRLLPGIW